MQITHHSVRQDAGATCRQRRTAALVAALATVIIIAGCATRSAAPAAAGSPPETVWRPVEAAPPAGEAGAAEAAAAAPAVLPAAAFPSPATAEQNAVLRDKWGVEIYSLRMSQAGYIVDFRYRVLDPAKAATLGSPENRPYLVDHVSGTTLRVPTTPKIGPLRQSATQLKPDKVYFVLFANPAKEVKSGSKVTVVIGDFRVEGLTVQ
ncbi:hypothetical protein GX586_02600 [bacterium]|nr:hypothetical protein [bacterium]